MTFGERLAELRNNTLKADGTKGWSRKTLAEASGISEGVVRSHEDGRREPSLRHLYAYCEAMGVSCDSFKKCEFRVKRYKEDAKAKPVSKKKKGK